MSCTRPKCRRVAAAHALPACWGGLAPCVLADRAPDRTASAAVWCCCHLGWCPLCTHWEVLCDSCPMAHIGVWIQVAAELCVCVCAALQRPMGALRPCRSLWLALTPAHPLCCQPGTTASAAAAVLLQHMRTAQWWELLCLLCALDLCAPKAWSSHWVCC